MTYKFREMTAKDSYWPLLQRRSVGGEWEDTEQVCPECDAEVSVQVLLDHGRCAMCERDNHFSVE